MPFDTYTADQHAPQVFAVHAPNGDIAALLDDRASDNPRTDEQLARDAEVIARALTDASRMEAIKRTQWPNSEHPQG